jgi:hypothetical protein
MRRYASSFAVMALLGALTMAAVPVATNAADSWASQHPWRIMTQSDATSASRCIGDPKTPLCAVETYEACLLRHDSHLCRRVRGSEPIYVPELTPRKGPTEKYRIVSQGSFADDDLVPQYLKVPDRVMIVLDAADCGRETCSDAALDKAYLLGLTYVVEPSDNLWIVVMRIECYPDDIGWTRFCPDWP